MGENDRSLKGKEPIGESNGGIGESPAVSVIMPVYNAGRYLRGAIDSVLAQTFRDFELILLDDGATDGSGTVCDEYAATDPRIRVKHGRNGGICASRNVGMELARGKWLAFCDHDDYMEPDLLEVALRAVEGTDCKLVKFNHATFRRFPDGTLRQEFAGVHRHDCAWSARQLLTAQEYPFFKALAGLVWDGLYLRAFVEALNLRFDESFKNGGEDFDFMTRFIAACGNGLWMEHMLYHHYYNVGASTSSSFHSSLLLDYLRTAHAERDLFPAAFDDPALRFVSFAEWTVPLVHFVFLVPGCPLSFCKQVSWLVRYHDELVGRRARYSCVRLPLKRRFLGICARWRQFWLYLLLKRIVVWSRFRLARLSIGKVSG